MPTETRRSIPCDIVIKISTENFCAFSWLRVVNQISIMYGMNYIKLTHRVCGVRRTFLGIFNYLMMAL